MEKKLAVVALGGNAILRGNQKGTVAEQNQNIRETLENLVYLIRVVFLFSVFSSVNSAMIDKSRYVVGANQEISFQLYDLSVYLIGTLMAQVNSRSLAVVFGGNSNQINVGQKATVTQLVPASGVTYSVSEETGKFNQITVKNNSAYNIVVLMVDLSGRNFVRL